MAQMINQEDWSNELFKPKYNLGDTIQFRTLNSNEIKVGFIYIRGQSLYTADIAEYFYHVKTIHNQTFIVNEEYIQGICEMLLCEILEDNQED